MNNYIRKEVQDAQLYQVKHAEGIKLNQNECPWDVPIELKVKICERLLKTDWNRYPVDDLVMLQKKIAKLHGLTPDQIVLANGSNVLIQALVNIIPMHHKILILDPTFSIYEMEAQLHGNTVIKVPLSEDFELLAERTLTEIKKQKPGLVFIANPNAPTGTLFDKRSLYRIIQMAPCPVVIDEAYYPFTEETVIEWLSDFDNLIILRTFSKAFALAGVRCGYLISNPELAQHVEKFLMTFRFSKVSSVILEEVLDNHDYLKGYVKKIVKERGRLFSKMQKIEGVQVYPSEANFLLFKVADPGAVAKKLLEQKVLVRNISEPGPLENCLRVGVGSDEETTSFCLP